MKSVLPCCNQVFLFLSSIIHLPVTSAKLLEGEKIEFCENLHCNLTDEKNVCGIRVEDGQARLRIFDNECELLQYGCRTEEEKAYGIINMKYCEKTAPNNFDLDPKEDTKTDDNCSYCFENTDTLQVCGIRKDGAGFRIRMFKNECHLLQYNCERNLNFQVTDSFLCNDMRLNVDNETKNEINDEGGNDNGMSDDRTDPNNHVNEINDEVIKIKNLVVVDGSMIDRNNINESIDNFFAATHVFDLPMREMQPYLNESMRRMQLKIAGPIQVFQPWVTIPKNISDDYQHRPTLSSCYHKCPTKCPETYAPVCGVPGIVAREPSLMFKNHCFMDVAQCKMHWEDKSDTAVSSAYIESSFLFCLGDEMNGLFRFLPLIRTLQHMGRLKKKGKFRYKFKNMRFFNNLLAKEPKLMG